MEGFVKQNVVQIEANSAVIGSADGEACVEVVIGRDAGEGLDGSKRIVGKDAAEVFDVGAGEREGVGAVLTGRLEWARGDLNLVGAAQVIGAENDLEGLGFPRVQVKLTLYGMIANR